MRSEVTVIFQSSPPVRQWVLSVPKRLRYFLQRDGAALNTALRIFLRVVQHNQEAHCPGDRARCANLSRVRLNRESSQSQLRCPPLLPPIAHDSHRRIIRACQSGITASATAPTALPVTFPPVATARQLLVFIRPRRRSTCSDLRGHFSLLSLLGIASSTPFSCSFWRRVDNQLTGGERDVPTAKISRP